MSLALDENRGGVLAGVAARFAHEDAERMRLLDEEIRRGRGCLAPIRQYAVKARAETSIVAHPRTVARRCACGNKLRSNNASGICWKCQPAPKHPVSTRSPKETTMPCGNCGSPDHNRRTCEKPAKTDAPKAPSVALAASEPDEVPADDGGGTGP